MLNTIVSLLSLFSSEISGYRDPVSLDQDDFNVTVRLRSIIFIKNYSVNFPLINKFSTLPTTEPE